jgi:hypothetical protein
MSNATSCRKVAAHFAERAAFAESGEERGAYLELQRLWSEMAAVAERFDRGLDGEAKAQIYALMGEVEIVRQKVA